MYILVQMSTWYVSLDKEIKNVFIDFPNHTVF